jgi:starvation-inducible outer membrane lipoprotein
MKQLKQLAALWTAAILSMVLAACATSPANLAIANAYDTVNAYVEFNANALMRDRITVVQAGLASAKAKKARDTIDVAAVALKACQAAPQPPASAPALPCAGYEQALRALQPMLLELERDLRAKQAAEAAKGKS